MSRVQTGRVGISKAIDYFVLNGYTVSIPLNDTQWYDLLVEKNGVIQTVQCKATTTNKGAINLRSMGGTNGRVYANILDNPLDILFCVDKDYNIYVIPMVELRKQGNTNTITLRKYPSLNHQGFESYKYLIA